MAARRGPYCTGAVTCSGKLPSQYLRQDESTILNPTDKARLDRHSDHICCSIQYPNAWYFKKARLDEEMFPDWVVLLIDPRYLWQSGTKFCPRNAAAEHGRLVRAGVAGFDAMFDEMVEGFQTYRRGPGHPSFLPTDEQAEVLIPDRVGRSDIKGFVVRDEAQAGREASRLELLGLTVPRIVIAPEFYDPVGLSFKLRTGLIPSEIEHKRGGADA